MKKLLSFILALAMVVCLIPAGVFAGEGGEILTTIHMNTTSPTARLYAASDSQKATNLLASVIANEKTYAISLNAGSYLLEAVGTDGLTENGSIVLHVSAETNTFTVVTVTMSCSNEDWAYDTDFAFEDLHVVSGGGGVTESRMVTMGNSVEANKKTVPVLDGDSVTVALDPSAAKKLDNYVKVNGNKTVNTGFDALSIDPATGTSLQVTYPYADEDADGNNDFILEAGQLLSGTYYRYTYMTPASISTPESNTVTANFVGLVKNNTYYYRVTNPSLEDAVTYGNYITLNKAVNTATVTADNLYLNNARNKHTVVDDFSLNTYDSGDLYLSVRNTELGVYAGFDGAAGTISMNVGDEINLYPFRNWLAIESTSNAKVIEPDFHVQVVTLDGTSPVSVTERMANDDSKHSFRVEANGEGTALLLVTYDAMTSDIAMGKKTSMDGKTFFSAIWPENTGVLVVSVDKESGIATGMTINESLNSAAGSKLSGEKLDAELDVLYYAGTQGAKYSFKPEQGTVVTKADPVYTDGRLNYGAFSTTGISTAADGTVTLFGLKQGKTLVKLVNGNKTAYQVIRARQTDYKVYTGTKAADSNLLYDSSTGFENAGIEVKAGDKIFVQYSDLQHPANKLSGIYNMTANVSALGEDGTLATGKGNQYNFGATASAHGVSLQLPKYWTEDTYSFEGILNVSGFGSYYGQHRDLAYETGKSPNFVAVQQNGYFGSLPGYTVNLGETDFVTVKLNPLDNDESAAKGVSFVVTDEAGVSSSVDGNGAFTALPGLTYSFRAFADGYEYKMGTIVVPAEQTADMTVDVVLEKAAEGAWDGSTKTEPQLIEDVYQIGTGAELAWLSSEIFEGRCLDAKVVLTADLDMGKYPLTPMGRKTSYNWQTGEINRDFQFNGTFDGNGKTIRNFYVSGSGNTGLFAYVKKAVIKDFTIEGLVESTGANTAAVAASVSGSAQISGVISKVDIKSSSNVVGAIIGNVSSAGVVVSQCANMGSISGKMSVAGLVGSTSSYLFTVNECFNTGAVSGTYRVGGIVGYANGASGKTVSISSCYNLGTITASASSNGTAGGLVGETGSYTSITDSYNAGAVTSVKTAAAISAAYGSNGVEVTNVFYLEGASDTKGTEKTAAQLKVLAEDLGSAYSDEKDSYPVLTWQTTRIKEDDPDDPGSGNDNPGEPEKPVSKKISVTFRLIGAEESEEDIDMSSGGGGTYVTWIKTGKYTLSTGATVGDLFKKALENAGLSYEGLAGNYISSIKAPASLGAYDLAEFTNGYYSGWMYTVNGSHPAVGLNDKVLQNNDVVVWHYVNDYRYEVEDWFDGSSGDEGVWNTWLLAEDKNPAEKTAGQAKTDEEKTTGGAVETPVPVITTQELTAATIQRVFTDVSSDAYYAEAVAWAVNHQITAGTGDKTFGAGRSCTRAQMITFLWNMRGKPAAKGAASFKDVPADSWFAVASAWGEETEITVGKPDGTLGAEDVVTREQVVTMLWKLAGKPVAKSTENVFADVDSSAYYAIAAAWAKELGITVGIGDNKFGVGQASTREQIVTMLYKYAVLIKE